MTTTSPDPPPPTVEERPYTKLYRDIWDDHDFTALSPDAKLIYLAIISNKKVTPCGAIDYLPTRLANATGINPPAVEIAVTELEAQRYVFVDREEGEIAVRSYVKNEIQIRNSKRCASVWSAWRRVQSAAIRAHLAISFPAELFAATVSNVPSEAAVLVDNYRDGIGPGLKRIGPGLNGFLIDLDLDLDLDLNLEPTQQHQPVQQQGISTDAAAAADPKQAMVDAINTVAARRNITTQSLTKRNPGAWSTSAINGIRQELIDAGAWATITNGASIDTIADLVAGPTDPAHQTVPADRSEILAALQPQPVICDLCDRDPRDHDDYCSRCNPDAPQPERLPQETS